MTTCYLILLFRIPSPLTVYHVLTKPNKNEYSSRCTFSSEYVARRVEADNDVLLQVRDESFFQGLMLLTFQFELIRNVLEFLFQNLKSSIGNSF